MRDLVLTPPLLPSSSPLQSPPSISLPHLAPSRLSTPARHGPIISPLSAPAPRHAPLRRSRPLPPLSFSPALLNVGTPEAALILLVGYFVLGPQDLYRVAKEVGQLLSNLQTAGSDAWKVGTRGKGFSNV